MPAVVGDISETGVSILVREVLVANFIEIVLQNPYPNAALVFDPVRSSLLSPECTDGFFKIAGPFVGTGLQS